MNSRTKIRLLTIVIVATLTSGCVRQDKRPDTAPADTETPSESGYSVEITVIKEKGGRVDWSHTLNLITFDKRGEDVFYDVYIMNPDGSDEYCLTCDAGLPRHHMGSPAWHPSGEWIVFQIVNTALIPSNMDAQEANAYTNPGAGWLNNLWVTDRKGHFYQLTDVDNTGGVLHPHFSHDGSKLLWAERIGGDTPDSGAGAWALQVADFVTEEEPVLRNIQSFTPGEQPAVFENYGFSPNDTTILFTGNLQEGQPAYGWDIYTLDIYSQELIQLTDTFYGWDEHAHYSPDGRKIVWTSSEGYGLHPLKADFWIMDSDGSNKRQVTFFNKPGHSHYMGKPIVAADSSWGPDGKTIIALIKTESTGFGSEGSIIMMEFKEPYSIYLSTYWFLLSLISGLIYAKYKLGMSLTNRHWPL